ncbi:MAG: tetratricopeptide repeat protein, partial [Gemmatimonadaceae bacterium]
ATYYHATLTRNAIATLARAVELSASASERERLIIRSEWAYASSSPSILAFAESLAVRYPAELEGHLYVGRAFVNLGRFMESVPLLQRVVDMDSASLSGRTVSCSACAALSWMLAAYMHADSSRAAEQVARRWVAVQGGSPSAWRALGDVLQTNGRWAEASEAYAVVSRLDSRNANVWDIQVPLLLRRGEFVVAERLASQHVASTPSVSSWWTVISRRHSGRVQAAIDEARRRIAAVGPTEPGSSMLLLLAQALFEGGQYRAAAAVFDSLARAPDPRLEYSDFARQRGWVLTHVADALAAAGDTARLAGIADSVRLFGAQTSYGRDRRLFHHVRGLLLRARGDS